MLYNQRLSIWDHSDSMPKINEITPASEHESQVNSQYPFDNRQLQQYKRAWTPEFYSSSETNAIVKRSYTKCIVAVLLTGILIGLFICGIPLAVMTTLYLQQKSQTSCSVTSVVSYATIGVTTSYLPSQCSSYSTNTDSTRNIASPGCSGCNCDTSGTIPTGWYRFTGGAGTRLTTTPISVSKCGADYPGWYNGTLPSTVGSVSSGTVCANYIGNLCYALYSVSSVLVTNCDSYYVFYLPSMSSCNSRYCTT